MSLNTGDVVWHEAPFKRTKSDGSRPARPWLIVSNDTHPFHGTEYVVLGMTTNSRSEGIRIRDSDWTDGGTSKTSYVSPWFAMTLKHADITHRLGTVTDALLTTAVTTFMERLGPVG